MNKNFAMAACAILPVLLLFGCASVPTSSFSSSAVSHPQSVSSGGTDEGVRTAKNVEEIPEMAEIHFSAAVDSQISEDLGFLQEIREHGLQYPYENQSFYNRNTDLYIPYAAYRYVIRMNLILAQQDADKQYKGNRDDVLQKMINDAFADNNIRSAGPNLFAWCFSNSDPVDNYDFSTFDNGAHSDSQFNLCWEDEGNVRPDRVLPEAELRYCPAW